MTGIFNRVAPVQCDAYQASDQMVCSCGLAWDMNDPEPPQCRKQVEAAKMLVDVKAAAPLLDAAAVAGVAAAVAKVNHGGSTVSRTEAHNRLRRLSDKLRMSPVATAHNFKIRTDSNPAELDYIEMDISGQVIRVPHEHAMKLTNPPGRMVVCAAISMLVNRPAGGFDRVVVIGPRHYDDTMRHQIERLNGVGSHGDNLQGFIDQWGVFMNREDALVVAYHAGQLGRRQKTHPYRQLFSEDLY